jgi:hypothetical protein
LPFGTNRQFSSNVLNNKNPATKENYASGGLLITSMAWSNKRQSLMKEMGKSTTTTRASRMKKMVRMATPTKMPLPLNRVGKGKQSKIAPLSIDHATLGTRQ